jgi:hypothetical protein
MAPTDPPPSDRVVVEPTGVIGEVAVAPPAASRVPGPTPLGLLWRFIKGFLVFVIVVFHLVVLAIRNPLDLWYKPIRNWMQEKGTWERYGERIKLADKFTWKYTNLVGCEQCWSMFSPPVARRAPFLGFRIDFTDGSFETLLSAHEPEPNSFFRIGGWQRRKLEDYLLYPDDLKNDPERSLWEAYARVVLRQWHKEHPDDPRKIERIVFLRRRIYFPKPDSDPTIYDPPTETEIASFDAEGRVLP